VCVDQVYFLFLQRRETSTSLPFKNVIPNVPVSLSPSSPPKHSPAQQSETPTQSAPAFPSPAHQVPTHSHSSPSHLAAARLRLADSIDKSPSRSVYIRQRACGARSWASGGEGFRRGCGDLRFLMSRDVGWWVVFVSCACGGGLTL
jgi:hypothetical protein